MFIGTVPPEARGIIGEILKSLDRSTEITVCCSGNFTIDKIASSLGFQVRSNDVSLYSRTIADIVMDRPCDMECVDPLYGDLFETWPEHRFKPLVMVMAVLRYSPFDQQKNEYQKVMWTNFTENHLAFFENTVAKLERNGALDFKIKEFYYGDFREHFGACAPGGVSFIFAPTYKAGYEKLYKRVDEVFRYEHASYEIFDSNNAGELYRQMLQQGKCVIYSDKIFPEIQPQIVGHVRLKGGKRDIYIYSNVNGEKSFICSYESPSLKKQIELVKRDKRFDQSTVVQVAVVETAAVNYFKHMFMSGKVDYSEGGDFGLVFFADGKAFGFATFSRILGTSDDRLIFLHSYFVCGSDQPRLSKLALSLLLSNEVKQVLMRKFMFKYDGMQTSVYTDKSESMKYGGVFELAKRDKGKLTYTGRFTGKSVEKTYQEWLKKTKSAEIPPKYSNPALRAAEV